MWQLQRLNSELEDQQVAPTSGKKHIPLFSQGKGLFTFIVLLAPFLLWPDKHNFNTKINTETINILDKKTFWILLTQQAEAGWWLFNKVNIQIKLSQSYCWTENPFFSQPSQFNKVVGVTPGFNFIISTNFQRASQ